MKRPQFTLKEMFFGTAVIAAGVATLLYFRGRDLDQFAAFLYFLTGALLGRTVGMRFGRPVLGTVLGALAMLVLPYLFLLSPF